jgi:hypothetical protein
MTKIFFHLSLLLLFLDPGSGMGKKQDPGSGINIPDPQHCSNADPDSAFKKVLIRIRNPGKYEVKVLCHCPFKRQGRQAGGGQPGRGGADAS